MSKRTWNPKTKKRIPTWGIRPGLTIGCKVTIRKNTESLIKRFLAAKSNTLKESNFSEGTISFGIPEYIDIPEAQYDAEVGIMGLDVSVTLQRPGYSIKRRAYQKKEIGKKHLISKEDTIYSGNDWVINLLKDYCKIEKLDREMGISATQVRELIAKDDDGWRSLVPNGTIRIIEEIGIQEVKKTL